MSRSLIQVSGVPASAADVLTCDSVAESSVQSAQNSGSTVTAQESPDTAVVSSSFTKGAYQAKALGLSHSVSQPKSFSPGRSISDTNPPSLSGLPPSGCRSRGAQTPKQSRLRRLFTPLQRSRSVGSADIDMQVSTVVW